MPAAILSDASRFIGFVEIVEGLGKVACSNPTVASVVPARAPQSRECFSVAGNVVYLAGTTAAFLVL